MAQPPWWSRLWAKARENAIGWAMGALVTGFLAFWKIWRSESSEIPLPVAISWGVLVAFAVIGFVNQYFEMRERAQARRLSQPTPAVIEKLIQDWAYKAGVSVTTLPHNDTLDFAMSAVSVSGMKMSIFKPKRDLYVVVRGQVKYTMRIGSIAEADVGLRLTELGVEFDIKSTDQATEVEIRNLLLFNESMHALRFYTDLALVERGILLVQLTVQRFQATMAAIAAQQAQKTAAAPTPSQQASTVGVPTPPPGGAS